MVELERITPDEVKKILVSQGKCYSEPLTTEPQDRSVVIPSDAPVLHGSQSEGLRVVGMCDYTTQGEIWPISRSERRKHRLRKNKNGQVTNVLELPERFPLVVIPLARVRKHRKESDKGSSSINRAQRRVY